jgi:hypothetical protein
MTSNRPRMVSGRRLLFLGGLMLAAALARLPRPACGAAEPDPEPPAPWPKTTPAHRAVSANNLKQIALAFHNFHDTYGAFPAAAITDKKGKALLSWRVAILPFVEQDALYKQFKLDEPWDSKHNKKLLARMPTLYAPPITGKPKKPHATYYQVFTGADTPFNPAVARAAGAMTLGAGIATFTDGTSNTVLLVEGKDPVPWTEPDDLPYDARKKLPKLGGLFKEGFHVALADGSVKMIGRKVDETTLRNLINPADGNVIDWTKAPPPEPEKKK